MLCRCAHALCTVGDGDLGNTTSVPPRAAHGPCEKVTAGPPERWCPRWSLDFGSLETGGLMGSAQGCRTHGEWAKGPSEEEGCHQQGSVGQQRCGGLSSRGIGCTCCNHCTDQDPGHLTSWLSAVGQVIYYQCSQFAQYKGEWILPDWTGRLLCDISNVCRVLSSVLGK